MYKYGLPLGIVVLIIIISGSIFWAVNQAAKENQSPASTPTTVRPSSDGLPGLLTSEQPWSNNTDLLAQRLQVIGFPQLRAEGTVLHIHQHLDLLVNGQPVPVPGGIGIPNPATFISTIHTHDASGIIHVESPIQEDFYLGQFFDVWGVKFSGNCIGIYCATIDKPFVVYVNGNKVTTDPRQLKLESHQEIVIAYGSQPNHVPSSYAFPAGD